MDRSLTSLTASIFEHGHDYLFCDKEFAVNNSPENVEVTWTWEGKENVEIWHIQTGEIVAANTSDTVTIAGYQGVFFVCPADIR